MLSSRNYISYYARFLAEKYISRGFEVNSNFSKNRAMLMLSKKELLEFTEDINNMINRCYEGIIRKFCFVSFLKPYQLEQRKTENCF